MAGPLVTIGIPCYNAARWIATSVQSALDQTCPPDEVIVVDDGSTDGSVYKLREFGEGIRVLEAAHRGANQARNLILKCARGEWIQYLDADDYLRPDKIKTQLAEAAPAEQADVIYSPVLMETWKEHRALPPQGERIDSAADIYTQLLRWELPQTGAALWRKTTLEGMGGWEEQSAMMCDEHHCYLRALKAETTLGPYADPSAVDKADIVVVQRMHASQVVQLVEYAQSRGKRVYYEVDDNLHAVMPSSPVYGLYHPAVRSSRVSSNSSPSATD